MISYFSRPQLLGFGLLFLGVIFYWLYRRNQGGYKMGSLFNTQTQALDMYSVDISKKAAEGNVDPVIGRAKEIMRVTQILTRRTKNNVILVGPPGVGKTAIIEGLALQIVTNDVPKVLRGKRVLSLQVAELLAGTKYRGDFEERIKRIVEEIRRSNRSIILFIDEIHTIMQTKGTEGSVNLSDILKPALARGDLQLIGATTHKEYKHYIQPEESWDRRFQGIWVDEPNIKESIEILRGIKKNYETYHQVRFSDDAIEAAVRLSEEYIKGRRLPDKAIDVIDEAAAMLNAKADDVPDHAAALLHGAGKKIKKSGVFKSSKLSKLKAQLEKLQIKEKDVQDDEILHELRKNIVAKVKEIEEEERLAVSTDWPVVTASHIKGVVAEWRDMNKKHVL